MPETIKFWVSGEPVGQGSMRHIGGGRMIASNQKALKAWREAIASAAREVTDLKFDSAVKIKVTFWVSRRPRDKKDEYPVHPYDLDKLCRAVGDAVSIECDLVANDSQIVEWLATKRFTNVGEPGVEITVTEM